MGHRRARYCRHCRRVAALLAILTLLALRTDARASELRRSPAVCAVEAAQPAVVNIHGQKSLSFNQPASHTTEASRRVNGMGTGVILDERGYILTNFHVVDGVREIQVTLANRETVIGRLVAHDRQEDLAIIKVDVGRPLATIPIGTSNDLMLAETVIAIGNAYGYEHTVTQGIVSSLDRDVQVSETQAYEDLIQTSAPINPGNSGGPLLNIDGLMVGINVAVRAGAQNIAFAIPVDRAIATATRLLSVERLNHTWHGIVVASDSTASANRGAVVEQVEPGSPAARIGIERGDKLRRIGNVRISRALDVERALLGLAEGETAGVELERDGSYKTVELRLAAKGSRSVSPELTPLQEKTWEVFGMAMESVTSGQFVQRDTPYNGGLKVLRVRRGGPAERQGIRPGDILVGMHGWETASDNDMRYIVTLPKLSELGPLKFYILRETDTLYGHLRIPRRVSKVVPTTR